MRVTSASEAKAMSDSWNREELNRMVGIVSRDIRRAARFGAVNCKVNCRLPDAVTYALHDRGYDIELHPLHTIISWARA